MSTWAFGLEEMGLFLLTFLSYFEVKSYFLSSLQIFFHYKHNLITKEGGYIKPKWSVSSQLLLDNNPCQVIY